MADRVSSRRIRQTGRAQARGRTPDDLSVDQAKEASTAANRQLSERNSVARDVPTRVNIQGGAKGGTVLLIAATLFTGYLYFTGKLGSVYAAISGPSRLGPGGSTGNPAITTPGGGVSPVVPGTTPGYSIPGAGASGYPRNFFIPIDPRYGNQPPLEISAADAATCAFLVYNGVIERTHSLALAETYVQQYCS